MNPGVIVIAEDAPLAHVEHALFRHHVHAVLVVGREASTPLGWVTVHGLLAWLEHDSHMKYARDAITEPPISIHSGASVREALALLLSAGVSHLLVNQLEDHLPEGVISAGDIVRQVRR
jgi:CBS domain-containing protein